MSLNNIHLTSQTCQNLYSENLIDISKKDTDKKPHYNIEINSRGENKKNILLLINDVAFKFLPDEEMEMLIKLLSACKLTMADIALVNYHSNPFNYQKFIENFEPKKILLFGVSTSQLDLPFAFPFFQIQQFGDQLYISAPPFKDFLNNKDLKKQLWISLQKLFL